MKILRLANSVFTSLIAFQLAIAPVNTARAALPVALGLPLIMRIGAPLSSTAFRYLVKRFGETTAHAIGSAELHGWIGAALIGVTYSNISIPKPTDAPANAETVDGPIIWVDAPDKSKFMNPDSDKFNDASTSGDKQPSPKTSVDATENLPANPSTFPAVVQDMGGGLQGTARYKASSAGQSKNVQVQYWYLDVDIALPDKASYQRCSLAPTVHPSGSPEGAPSWCGSVTVAGTSSRFAVWSKTTIIECPSGYTKAGDGGCNLTNASTTTKPSNQNCEFIRTASGWISDSKNPNCSGLSDKVSTSLTTVHVEDGEQENDPSKPLVDDTLGVWAAEAHR